jgi:hypothetical protein
VVRLRLLWLRILAALLVVAWVAATLVILVGYRPGGRFDAFVAAAPVGGVGAAAAAGLWPPLFRSSGATAAAIWLGVGTLLIVVPTIAELASRIGSAPGGPVLPSPEVVYAWLVAMGGTNLYCGLGVSRYIVGEGRDGTATRDEAAARDGTVVARRVAVGLAIAILLTGCAAVASGAAIVANEGTLAHRTPGASDWGPTDPGLTPPLCDGSLSAGASAVVEETASASAPLKAIGTASLSGIRSGSDSRWEVRVDGWPASDPAAGVAGRIGYRRVANQGWQNDEGGPWRPAPLDDASPTGPANPGSGPVSTLAPGQTPFVPPNTLDQSVIVAALPARLRLAADDLGLELIGGASARHCRLAVDGPTALAAFRPLRILAGQHILSNAPALEAWRGNLDWWVFGDGELGMAEVSVGGISPPGWPSVGIAGTLTARLTARARGSTQAISPP